MKLSFFVAVIFAIGINTNVQVVAQDGKTYKTVKIGRQLWMAENLNVSTYRNGDTIPQVQDPKVWSNFKTGAWCYYEGDERNGEKYGKLYNWYAVVDSRGLAPKGWHIPSDDEWTELSTFLGGKIESSSKIKSSKGWTNGGNGNNETGFTALPAGIRSVELFSFEGRYTYWWSSTEFDSYSAWNRYLGFNTNDIGRSTGWKQFGNSIRCIKDADETNDSKLTQAFPENKKFLVNKAPEKKETAIAVEETNNLSFIKIGEQAWLTQNLDVATFQNGDTIPEAKNIEEWESAGRLKRPAWCYYYDDTANEKYGKLYNWYAINDKRGLAPKGWHIPTEAEWMKLVNESGGEKVAGGNLQSNENGFKGYLSGFRDVDGEFHNIGTVGYWWGLSEISPGEAWSCSVNYFSEAFNSDGSPENKGKGFSVRCIKD